MKSDKLHSLQKRIPFGLLLAFSAMVCMIIVGGYYFLQVQKKRITESQYHELAAIADLKVYQIGDWRRERRVDGEVLFNSPVFIDYVEQYLYAQEKAAFRTKIQQQLKAMLRYGDYSSIYLLDAAVKVRLLVNGEDKHLGPFLFSAATEALRTKKIIISDLHFNKARGFIHMDIIVPLVSLRTNPSRAIGVVVLQIDPNRHLYQRIQSWPTPSPSGETLLVRREGTDVVFLNELRHKKETALALRLPADDPDLPAALAVRGYTGIIDGIDYRGMPVLAATRQIPDSNWFIVSKIDKSEVLAPFQRQTVYVIVVMLLMFIATGAVTGVLLQRERVAQYHLLLASEMKRQEEHAQADAALQKLLEDLKRSNTELQQFAYIASHDLQEPLRMVSSFMQLLEQRYKGKLDKDADEFIQYAVDGAVRMQRMINDLLSYSRIGTKVKPFGPVDCNKILADVRANLKLSIEETGAMITADPLPIVNGDASQLLQVFQNLLANAIKFRGDKVPEIRIRAEQHEQEWQFSVQDNGVGFDQAYVEKIFVIFQRLHTASKYPGSGIGLTICKKIIERHHGRIWAESELGKGAIFYFTLPVLV